MDWLIANWAGILFGITGIVTGASTLAKLTPTEVDNALIAKALKFLDLLALNNKPTEQRKR